MNYVHIEIPPNIQEHWDWLVDMEGNENSSTIPDEKYLQKIIIDEFGGENIGLYANTFLNGFEVDIILRDKVTGAIFAIIESDGDSHDTPKRKNNDHRRDQYLLSSGITDLIIRKTRHGCRIVSNTR